tara:strand:- start:2320 stop:3411 length:1092 start_codon:yes stop_codon:yes gene_type:complete
LHYFIDKPSFFAVKLLAWFEINQRPLLWRSTKEAYKIWLSEIILQQTRVEQGTSYYVKFISNYPKLKDLALADEETVLKDWQGLGYYSRARNLHFTARYIYDNLNGEFPKDYTSILQLKGIGEYTAAAIASFAFDLPHAVVDGNVYRVLARIFGIETAIDSSQGKKEFKELANHLLDQKNPALFNQSIMEFGALHCVPSKPDCNSCIFQKECVAHLTNQVNNFPVKAKKIKQRKRHFHYLIFENSTELVVKKRVGKEIWQNLYDFPLIETKNDASLNELLSHEDFKKILKEQDFAITASSTWRKHILSHQIIMAKFYHLQLTKLDSIELEANQIIAKETLSTYPIPKLIENYLKEETNLLSLS